MSAWTNEVEERRMIRLLANAAADVAPLSSDEVDRLLRSATQGVRDRPRSRRRLSRLQPLIAAAAAAVVVGVTLGSSVPGTRPDSPAPAATKAQLASFPEGSALQLLLSANGRDSAS